MREKVMELVDHTRLEDPEMEKKLSRPIDEDELVEMIDVGGKGPGVGTKGRVWTNDPVDGTKTFLAGTQYAVVMTLLEDGKEILGVIACPKVDLESGKCSESDCAQDGPGWIVSAVRGQGAYVRQISTGIVLPGMLLPQLILKKDPKTQIMVKNMQNATPRFPERQRFATEMHCNWPPVHIYSSQVTYVALALGIVDYQIRAPVPTAHPSYVWDHAGGILIDEECGGMVTDLRGKSIVFSTEGRELKENYGNIGGNRISQQWLVDMVNDLFEPYPEYTARLIPPILEEPDMFPDDDISPDI
jgi:3'(2'), 5'-bisphosphate nucleotidase